ncbi:acetyl-CoA carboxylase, carboxyltransferase subunit beta [Treponema medium]|uniref:Acetyl-coenzyme A carboxylase carboxyl transferase subunit beta n=2 Tax=Treponema medium TaxID=58231 RepID=A0AA87TFP8_TREMD|nr:acetyl-CoA carboxylase, carboxyltransferase subunit beta [Treponema medium]EPF29766.1 acetyl-coenzyme A carboxylase carboxyl transferase subunit beta [Treponema medium ATCC 700293]QSH91501.1 acetyl-CoA carboxylase, carboxyltransferase subunit beta [Treponema medium]QSH96627.1 acetyl-CoA carboxylase, carboxyltransferase subunit beta [Treponema medium]
MECPHCKKQYERETLLKHLMVCPDCGYHMRMDVPDRIAYLTDKDTFEELDTTLRTMNPIQMAGYEEKISAAEAKTSMNEAVVTGKCKIEGRDALLGIMSFDFLGGSMGSVVGEKISRLMLKGAAERIPVIIYATSGGARMQEGLFSLMQMAKTSSAAAELDDKGVPFFLMLCDPTTGGVTASFAMLGDVIAAEPNALIGFAGPRVIEGTIHQQLPEGFQRAEFQLKKGFVDRIVPRIEQKHFFAVMIDAHMNPPFGKERK